MIQIKSLLFSLIMLASGSCYSMFFEASSVQTNHNDFSCKSTGELVKILNQSGKSGDMQHIESIESLLKCEFKRIIQSQQISRFGELCLLTGIDDADRKAILRANESARDTSFGLLSSSGKKIHQRVLTNILRDNICSLNFAQVSFLLLGGADSKMQIGMLPDRLLRALAAEPEDKSDIASLLLAFGGECS